jgi:hypothetical protein
MVVEGVWAEERRVKNAFLVAKNRHRLVSLVQNGSIQLFQLSENELVAELAEKGFDELGGENFSYLLSIPISSFTKEKMELMHEEVNSMVGSKPHILYKMLDFACGESAHSACIDCTTGGASECGSSSSGVAPAKRGWTG